MLVTIAIYLCLLSFLTYLLVVFYGIVRHKRSELRKLSFIATIFFALTPALSLTNTLLRDPEPFLTSGANWVRNHGFGVIVDRLEKWKYSAPPSQYAATELSLNGDTGLGNESSSTTTTLELMSSAVTTNSPIAASTIPPETMQVTPQEPTDTTQTTTTTLPYSPAPLGPIVTPTLEGEAEWQVVSRDEESPVVWATSLRPLENFPSVTLTAVALHRDRLRFALHNGYELPGGSWLFGSQLLNSEMYVPVAAFNGGFRFEHIDGGYFTEGVEVEPLAAGEATLAIDPDGKLHLGEWGTDLAPTENWVSVRQSLPLIVRDGSNMVTGTWAGLWGVDHGNVTYVFRSGVCETGGGDFLYFVADDVDAALFAEAAINLGCSNAMQLDINGNWPQFAIVENFDEGLILKLMDRRMSYTQRYAEGSKKDFIGVYRR